MIPTQCSSFVWFGYTFWLCLEDFFFVDFDRIGVGVLVVIRSGDLSLAWRKETNGDYPISIWNPRLGYELLPVASSPVLVLVLVPSSLQLGF